MTEQYANRFVTTIVGSIDGVTDPVSVTLTAAPPADLATGNWRAIVEDERFLVIAVAGAVVTMSRAQEGSSIAAHAAGTTFVHNLTRASLLNFARKDAANTFTEAQTIDGGSTAKDRLNLGTDTNLYRSAADTLKTDDSLHVATRLGVGALAPTSGQIASLQAAAATDKVLIVRGAAAQSANLQEWQDSAGANVANLTPGGAFYPRGEVQNIGSGAAGGYDAFSTYNSGETVVRWSARGDGQLSWGSGAATQDTTLYRSAADVLKTDDKLHVALELEVDGALNHDGTTVGFYGTAPTTLQTGVAVTAAAIHAALVNLGLITA